MCRTRSIRPIRSSSTAPETWQNTTKPASSSSCLRKDYQIKHMGHRIELGEIEANVNSVDGVKLCGCIYYKEKERIILYYVGDPDKAALMAELKDMLPRYMLPNRIEKLDEMPFTANGKINRVRLKEMYEELLADKKERRNH